LLCRSGFFARKGDRLALCLQHLDLAKLRHDLLRRKSFPGHLLSPFQFNTLVLCVFWFLGQKEKYSYRLVQKKPVRSGVGPGGEPVDQFLVGAEDDDVWMSERPGGGVVDLADTGGKAGEPIMD
jgi:hypothetical protein